MICELSTKNYNNLFLEALKQIAEAEPDQFGSILRTYLLSQTSDIGRWPNDDEFQDAWRKLDAYKRIKPQPVCAWCWKPLNFYGGAAI